MKKLIASMLIGLFAAMTLVCNAVETQSDLQNGIIRLHVRANSNTDEDQSLKLKVRDAVLAESSKITQGSTDRARVREAIAQGTARLAQTAKEEIQKNGFDYPVKVTLGKSRFPTRAYDGLTLPAGTYEALTVDIGSGGGDNWWCVMFPPLCFARETFAKTDEDTDLILSQLLGSDTYSLVSGEGVEIKFKIYEVVEKIISRR